MHEESGMVAVILFVIGFGFMAVKLNKTAYVFMGAGALMVIAGVAG